MPAVPVVSVVPAQSQTAATAEVESAAAGSRADQPPTAKKTGATAKPLFPPQPKKRDPKAVLGALALRQLKLMVRTHTEISQAVCALCGWPNLTLKTGTGLYDGTVHLGDVCKLCLRGGKRGAAMRTRAHAVELRSLAENGPSTPRN